MSTWFSADQSAHSNSAYNSNNASRRTVSSAASSSIVQTTKTTTTTTRKPAGGASPVGSGSCGNRAPLSREALSASVRASAVNSPPKGNSPGSSAARPQHQQYRPAGIEGVIWHSSSASVSPSNQHQQQQSSRSAPRSEARSAPRSHSSAQRQQQQQQQQQQSSIRREGHRGDDLESVLEGMRVTIACYRDAVQASDEEKEQLLDTIRVLREELAEARGGTNVRRNGSVHSSSSRQRSVFYPEQQQQQNNEFSSRDLLVDVSQNPTLHPPLNERAGGGSSSNSASPERMTKELAISQEKQDSLARELQRVHHDYNAEIRRLQRTIAKLEGQLVEITEFSYAGKELDRSNMSGGTPSIRPK